MLAFAFDKRGEAFDGESFDDEEMVDIVLDADDLGGVKGFSMRLLSKGIFMGVGADFRLTLEVFLGLAILLTFELPL